MFNPGFTRPSLLKGSSASDYRAFTFFGPAFHPVRSVCRFLRVRSPLLTESLLLSFPVGTEMFQFSTFAPYPLCIQR
jgi:hypothetical protein